MGKFIFYRVLQAIPVLWVVITITFFLVRFAPGGPFDSEKSVPPVVKAALEAQYKLDQPLINQYFSYMGDLLKGDLGPTFKYPGRSVNELIATGFPVTAELGLYAILVALVIGGIAGLVAALKPNTTQDYVSMSIAMIGICMPTFLLGPLLVLVFGIWLEWLPVSGWGDLPGDKILPSITLGAMYAAYVAAYLGPAFAGILSGSFVIETVFQIHGLGRFYVQAAFNRDYTLILGCTVFLAGLIILFNLLSDIVAAYLNPRLRAEVGGK